MMRLFGSFDSVIKESLLLTIENNLVVSRIQVRACCTLFCRPYYTDPATSWCVSSLPQDNGTSYRTKM